MKFKGLWLIGLGLVLAVVAGIFSQKMIAQATGDTPVVVAVHPIPAYTQIKPEDVKVVMLPANSIAKHAAHSLEQVVGRFTRTMIVEGSQITKDHVSVEGQDDLASLLTTFDNPDMRAFALPSQNPMILQIRPGNRVDLYAALETENGTESLLVAEQVLVLGQVSPEEPVGLILALTRDQINTLLPLMDQIQVTLVPYNATMSEQVQNVTEMNNQNGEEDA